MKINFEIMKLYYLFLLIMYFVLSGCTGGSTYSNKYDYSTKKDTTKSVVNKRRNYSTSGYYNNTNNHSYKKKNSFNSRKTHRMRRHRR